VRPGIGSYGRNPFLLGVTFIFLLRVDLELLQRFHCSFRHDHRMADFLVVLGLVAFVVVMLALIEGLDRV